MIVKAIFELEMSDGDYPETLELIERYGFCLLKWPNNRETIKIR